jgi:DNA-binding transcriptional LysR family regulator
LTHRALRYFLAVVRAGSIRGAAEALHVAASAISRQIAELEAELGETLLERLPRGVAPTEAGRILAEHAQRQEEEAQLLEDRLARLRGGEEGVVRLSVGAGFLPVLIDQGLAGFSRAHPGIGTSVALGTTAGILAAVADGDADIGLAYNPPAHAALEAVAISRQPVAAILRPDHPLAGLAAPHLRDFAQVPAALTPPDHGVRQLLGRVEADGGFRLTQRMETASFELQRRFAMAGLGVTFMPGFSADLAGSGLVALPLRDPLLAEASAHLLVRAGRRLPVAVAQLLHWLRREMPVFVA